MELKDTTTILLDKNTQKVKCFKFISKELERELALHENVDNKGQSSVTDVKTGMRLFDLPLSPKQVKEESIKDKLDDFIKHFTLESIQSKFIEEDEVPMEEKIEKRKKK